MIKSVYFNSLTKGDFIAFMSDVVTLYNRVSHPTLAPYVIALTDAVADLKTAYGQERGSVLTDSVQEMNKRRDDAIRGIKTIAKGYLFHADPTVRGAADLLLRSMNKYSKRINKLNQREKSATIKALLNEWTNDVMLADAINLLHLQDWKQELSATNTDFRTIFLDRVQGEAEKSVPPVTRQRPAVTEVYRTLKRQTLAYAQISPVTYTPLVNDLEELIAKYRR